MGFPLTKPYHQRRYEIVRKYKPDQTNWTASNQHTAGKSSTLNTEADIHKNCCQAENAQNFL